MFLETQQLSEKTLKQQDLSKLVDYFFRIQQAVSGYYLQFKKDYLVRGFEVYQKKLGSDLVKEMVFELNTVLAQNSLILQKISHTHDLEIKVGYDMMTAERMNLKSVIDKKDLFECN